MKIVGQQSEEEFTQERLSSILAGPSFAALPPYLGNINGVIVGWIPNGRNAYIMGDPKAPPVDRQLAEGILYAKLAAFGYERPGFDLSGETLLLKESAWASPSVLEKAKRLVKSGAVLIQRNSMPYTVGLVQGDTEGLHQVELQRADINNPYKLSNAFCDCTWGKFLNTIRTREFKRFQHTPCSHIIATAWKSMATPFEEGESPWTKGGPEGSSEMPPGGAPAGGIFEPDMPQGGPDYGDELAQYEQERAPQGAGGISPAEMYLNQMIPTPGETLPPFPYDQQQPQRRPVNPASSPLYNPGPTPGNPIQMPAGPGSVFSSANDELRNGDIVALKKNEIGLLQGRMENYHGSPTVTIPAGSAGEVLGVDPITGMVNILFAGEQFEEYGEKQPFGATVWCLPSNLIRRTYQRRPGPIYKRRR